MQLPIQKGDSMSLLGELSEMELSVHLQPHGALLVDRKSMFYYRLSGRGVQLALLLAENNSLQKTARIWEIVTKEEMSADKLKEELSTHPFTAAWTEGLLDKRLMITGSTKSYLPISCTLQFTNSCNLSCSFCYASSGKPYQNELNAFEWIEVMEKLAAHGVADITITGGEAKLIKGFKELITAASSLFTNVNLFSNGLNWRDEEIELLKHLGNVCVQISIDGSADTHDLLRGRKGSFKESMRNVKRMTDSSLSVIVAMTINELNACEVLEVIENSVESGATIFRAGRTLNVGRASDTRDISSETERLVKQQLKKAISDWGDQIIIIDWEEEKNGVTDFCTPGYLAWYIRADGYVTPCQIEESAIGHILEDSMLDIGSPERLMQAKCNAKHCRCIGKIELSEPDLPFSQIRIDEVKS